MPNQKISGGRSVGGVAPAPAFVADLLDFFGSDEAATAAFVDSLRGFWSNGVAAQATVDLAVATGSPTQANGRLIRDSLPSASVESFDIFAETNLQVSGADFVNTLNASYTYTVI
jgi:hypothetical protein